jgi:4-diphosphocytidyl-2-C-methyl-D-erythritol kinase
LIRPRILFFDAATNPGVGALKQGASRSRPAAEFVLPSFAKINLALEVLHLRSDGYHELRTLYQSVDLRDELHFRLPRAGDRSIDLVTEGYEPCPAQENLVYRAAMLLRRECGISRGARLHLAKRIPSGAGLGGGSSNAAVTLLGLDRLWNLKLGAAGLVPLAMRLGSDVPFFLVGGTALGVGRGEQVFPVAHPGFRWVVILHPPVHVSTAEAYAQLRRPLTRKLSAATISRLGLLMSDGKWEADRCFNDFEVDALKRYPEIRAARETLLKHGALAAQLSGSGSAVFGIFPNRNRAHWALSRIERHPWKAYLVKTVDRACYRRALGESS